MAPYSGKTFEYGAIPYAFPEVNTGVIVFKKCEGTKQVFDYWKEYHQKYYALCPYDQPSFRISLWKSEVKAYIMPIEYNVRSQANRKKQDNSHHEFGEEHMTARMYHMHHGQANVQDARNYCKQNFQPY